MNESGAKMNRMPGTAERKGHFFENYKEFLRKKCFSPTTLSHLSAPHFQSSSAVPECYTLNRFHDTSSVTKMLQELIFLRNYCFILDTLRRRRTLWFVYSSKAELTKTLSTDWTLNQILIFCACENILSTEMRNL